MASEPTPHDYGETGVEEYDDSTETDESGISWKMGITAAVMGLIIGGFGAWATSNLGIAILAFLALWAGATYYLYQKPIPSAAIGSGLWITALVMLLTPVLFYLPVILGDGAGESAEAAGTFVGGILGLIIWGIVFTVGAIVVAAIGWAFKRRADNKLENKST
ncbi:hypothetical protein CV102_17290 [Natronococcus pandeyae]|uniref:Uncharacterized protein n=1 Tax=Natronococcus pandeyae TaxID=2055836 RepID=A0A8J8TPF3_9EURY|nr:hypothetical protein [Natronococcus pandeyae]TYL37373.1 hypothetical protein CV102_17290 [Natronococcus pandeyae]